MFSEENKEFPVSTFYQNAFEGSRSNSDISGKLLSTLKLIFFPPRYLTAVEYTSTPTSPFLGTDDMSDIFDVLTTSFPAEGTHDMSDIFDIFITKLDTRARLYNTFTKSWQGLVCFVQQWLFNKQVLVKSFAKVIYNQAQASSNFQGTHDISNIFDMFITNWMNHLEPFFTFASVLGLSCLNISLSAWVYIVRLWENSKHGHSAMQAKQATWFAAATIAPLILEPFLSDHAPTMPPNSSYPGEVHINNSKIGELEIQSYDNISHDFWNESKINPYTETIVHLGFLTIADISLVAAIVCIVAFLYENNGILLRQRVLKANHTHKRKLWFKVAFLITLCLFWSAQVANESRVE